MVFRFDLIYFGAGIFFLAITAQMAYRRKHLEELEKRGAIKPQIATAIRNLRRPWLTFSLGFLTGLIFLVMGFIRI